MRALLRTLMQGLGNTLDLELPEGLLTGLGCAATSPDMRKGQNNCIQGMSASKSDTVHDRRPCSPGKYRAWINELLPTGFGS